MIIVNDIQDAEIIKRKIDSMIRRHSRNKDAAALVEELTFLAEDLDANIERIDNENFIENN